MREHHLTVPRTARFHTLGEPTPETGALWIVCHGYGQLAARFLQRFAAIVHPSRAIVAPEALSRFYLDAPGTLPAGERRVGATWMTREDRLAEIADQVSYLDALHAWAVGAIGRAPRVTVLGFSQGAATASRWVAASEARVDRLVLWGGGLPPDLDPRAHRERLASSELTLVVGERDALIPDGAVAEAEARLVAAGVPYRLVRYDGGHDIDAETLHRLTE
jgi:predicted esterase